MNKVIGTGRNLDIAIENALSELGATRDEVTIKVISEGGLFSKAKVEVIRDDAIEAEFNNIQTIKQQDEDGLVINANVKKNENKKQEKVEIKKVLTDEIKVNLKKVDETKAVNSKKVKEIKTQDKIVEQKSIEKSITHTKVDGDVVKYIEDIIKFSKAENISLDKTEEERCINLKVTGDKLGTLIGNNGETLLAIEHIANVYSGMCEVNKRVKLDIGNYRIDKEDKLKSQADKAVQIALMSGEYKFQPMAARERRIIHAYLQDREDVKTFSKGVEPKRFLIVAKKEDKVDKEDKIEKVDKIDKEEKVDRVDKE